MVTNEKIISAAYTLIRRKSKNFEGCKNEELGAYVNGIVDLQMHLYDYYEGKTVEELLEGTDNEHIS